MVLFPQSIDFYQIELTRMLETDRFAEAARMLRFLIGCESGDPSAEEEWQSLLSWLETTFPETTKPADAAPQTPEPDDSEEEHETETELLSRHLNERADTDDAFVLKLFEKLERAGTPAEQMIALEQLALIRRGDRDIEASLIRWLQAAKLSPVDQFAALQALGRRGVKTEVVLPRPDGPMRAKPSETPQSPGQFPESARRVLSIFHETCGMDDPMLAAFAEQTWHDLLAFYYGTETYERLKSADDEQSRIWAAALHERSIAALQGERAAETADIFAKYGVEPELESDWQAARKALKAFIPGL
ncbi:hypothetical protein [Paenibacillus sp. MBLB4367]|uniref:hypothetical protein n=1 Tax=Paenibacillus sp. MBLB4367 TaxID=3384767 RepID=UPI0039083E3D